MPLKSSRRFGESSRQIDRLSQLVSRSREGPSQSEEWLFGGGLLKYLQAEVMRADLGGQTKRLYNVGW